VSGAIGAAESGGSMRIVIVGATGNIGTAILRRLHSAPEGTELVGIARRLPDELAEPYRGVRWHSIDVSADRAVSALTRVFEGADAVVHLAWLLQPNRNERVLWATNVDGTRNALRAIADAHVPHGVFASSVGAYSRGPKDRRVSEDWPTGGVHSSHYSRHKAVGERMFDRFEATYRDVVLTRIRPGLVFQRDAATEIARLFLGPLFPTRWLGVVRPPILPMPVQVVSQAVHADDLADAFWRAIERRAGGAFNIAGEPVLSPDRVAEAVGARSAVPVRRAVARAALWATWKLRLQVSDPGWLDIATNVPVMSTERARAELGWVPSVSTVDALREVVEGMGQRAGLAGSPALQP
jgi:UDP-glucose 4-epimerase